MREMTKKQSDLKVYPRNSYRPSNPIFAHALRKQQKTQSEAVSQDFDIAYCLKRTQLLKLSPHKEKGTHAALPMLHIGQSCTWIARRLSAALRRANLETGLNVYPCIFTHIMVETPKCSSAVWSLSENGLALLSSIDLCSAWHPLLCPFPIPEFLFHLHQMTRLPIKMLLKLSCMSSALKWHTVSTYIIYTGTQNVTPNVLSEAVTYKTKVVSARIAHTDGKSNCFTPFLFV